MGARESDSFGIYLREIVGFPLLARAEEQDYAQRLARGDETARRALVQANLRFVVHLARRYGRRGSELKELVSAGNIGLLRAAEHFDPGRDCRFVTYASWWVRRAIRDAANASERWFPSAPVPASRRGDRRTGEARPLSLDAPFSATGRSLAESLADSTMPSPEQDLAERTALHHIRKAVRLLPERQALVLERRYGLNGAEALPTEALARLLGISRSRVLQLERRALDRLRKAAGPSLRSLVS